jgi:lipoyl-dependent peroxiredoxin
MKSAVTAHVTIGRNDKGFFELAVELEVSVPDRPKAEIEELVRIAHEEVCPYSRATRGNIEVKPRVV